MSRYVVTEIEGWPVTPRRTTGPDSRNSGLSVHVLDTAYCYRVVGSWRIEDLRGYAMSRDERRESCREQARALAARLNLANEVATGVTSRPC